MFGNFTYVYYDLENEMHRYIFKDHPFVNMFKDNIFKNEFEFENFLMKKKSVNQENEKKLKKMYGLSNNSFTIIPQIFNESENKFSKNKGFFLDLKKKLVLYAIKKILLTIKTDIEKDNYSIDGYNNFRKKFKFSLSRIILFLLFKNTSSRLDLANIIYKYCIGRNFIDHSVLENKGHLYNMNIQEIKKFFKFYDIKFDKKVEFKLNKESNILTFFKAS